MKILLENARIECGQKATWKKNASALPGIVEKRFGQLQEIEAIPTSQHLTKKNKNKIFPKKYLENYQRALSSPDVERYVDGEADVVDMEKIITSLSSLRNKWLGIPKEP